MRDPRLKDKRWRRRVGFDNIHKAIWTTPTVDLYYSRKGRQA